MIRKFLTPDGDVLDETDWDLRPIDACFYCNTPLWVTANESFSQCYESQDGSHDWITLVNPSDRR